MLMEEQQLKREQAEIEIENWTNKAIREMLFFDEQENLKFQFIQMGIVKSIPELNIRRKVLNELLTVVFMDAIGMFPVVVEKIYMQWRRNLEKQEEKRDEYRGN